MASSAGALQKAYDTRMQSTQAHINQFNASFQELSSTLINSNMLKFAIDTGTALVSLANGLQKVHLLLPSIIGMITVIKGIRFAKSLSESASKVQTLIAATLKEKVVTDSLAQSVSVLTLKEKQMFVTNVQNAVASKDLTAEEGRQILTTLGLATADGTLTVANKGLAGSFKTLMASIPVWGWVSLGVSMLAEGIVFLTSQVDNSSESIKNFETAFKETQNEILQISNEYKNLKESADEVIPRFVKLAEGVDDFGKKVSLTDEEYKEFLSLNNKIAEMFPQLNMGMDDNGNYMLALSYSADTLRESLEELLEVQRQEANEAMAKKMPQNISEAIGMANDSSRQIEEIESRMKIIQSGKFSRFLEAGDLNFVSNIQAKKEYDEFVDYLRSKGIEVQEIVEQTIGGTTYKAVWDQTSERAINLLTGGLKQVADIQSQIASKWKSINPSIIAWLQTDYLYKDMNPQMQLIAQTMTKYLDFNELGLVSDDGEETSNNIKTYITKYIINPLYSSSDEVQNAFSNLLSQLQSGEITESDFSDKMHEAFDKLIEGMNPDDVKDFTNAFVKGFNEANIAGEDYDAVVNSLIKSWVKLGKVDTTVIPGSSSLTELLSGENLENVKTKVQDVLSPLLDAYNKLQKGELSSSDILTLISDKFPSLINYTNNLSVGIQKLAKDELDKLKEQLNEVDKSNLSEDDLKAYNKFIEYIDSLNNGFNSNLVYLEKIQTNLKNVSSTITTLITLKDEINKYGSLSASSIEKIMSDNSLAMLRPYINDVKSMMPIITALIDDQKSAYEDLYNEQQRLSDPDAYIEASREKQREDENAFQNSIKRINEQVSMFNEKYGVDLSNWEKIEDGKKSILQNTNAELLSKQLKLINSFSEYYNTDLDNYKNTTAAKAAILKNFRDTEMFSQATKVATEKGLLHNHQGAIVLNGENAQKEIDNILAPVGLTWKDYVQYLNSGTFTKKGEELIKKQLDEIVKAYTISSENWENMTAGIGGSSSSGGSKSKGKTWFEEQYNYHNHLVKMEQETEKDYLDWLDGAYKKAYNQGIIDLDTYYKYEEEVYNGRKKLTGESTSWFEKQYKEHQHRLKMETESEEDYLGWLESAYKNAYSQGLINLDEYRKYQEEVYEGRKKIFEKQYKAHQHYLKMEKEDQSDYLKWLDSAYKQAYKERLITLDEYKKYQEEVYEGIKQLKNNAESAIKELINIRINMLKEDVNKEKEAIKKKLDYLKDFYQKQKDMLQDKYDEEKYLEEQAEKRKSVSDIQAEMNQLRFDNSAWAQKRRIELQKDLTEAQKNLKDFEKDHALNDAKDRLDKLYEQQEKTLNDQSDALDKKINNPQELYQQALNDIRNGSQSLYQQMIEWNNVYGDGIRDTIKNAWEEAYKAEKQYFNYTGRHYNGVNLSNATLYVKGRTGYASGTSHSTAGLHKVDEQGIETIFQSSDGQRYRMFSSGEKVLNAGASDFLYKFANRGTEILGKLFGNSSNNVFDKVHPVIAGNEFNQGDIIINGNADRATVSEIRRAQRESLEQMLKQFNRLK